MMIQVRNYKEKFKEELKTGALLNEMVVVGKTERYGKTEALIEFAKENDLTAIFSGNVNYAHFLQKEFNYDQIYTTGYLEVYRPFINSCVVDDNVNIDKHRLNKYYNIVTGYVKEPVSEFSVNVKVEGLEDMVIEMKSGLEDVNEILQNIPYLDVELCINEEKLKEYLIGKCKITLI
jgi:hypothetical protein